MEKTRSEQDKIWRDGIFGVVTGDALGCPVQFHSREEVARSPVTDMRGYGTFHLPPGTWTDDSSMTLALLDSIRENQHIDLIDTMDHFVRWMMEGEFTPFGESFDIGRATSQAVQRYRKQKNVNTCGGKTEKDNGNGSLMRILPACLYAAFRQKEENMSQEDALAIIHAVSGLTHNHPRAKIACGLYYGMVRSILAEDGPLVDRLQHGLDEIFAFYKKDITWLTELAYYGRLHNLYAFAETDRDKIRSSGYVVDTLEAAVWCLLKTNSFRDALLLAVNLGEDTDTVGAVCGGLAGLFYGYEAIPEEWRNTLQRKEWIEHLCQNVLQ